MVDNWVRVVRLQYPYGICICYIVSVLILGSALPILHQVLIFSEHIKWTAINANIVSPPNK